MIFEASRSFARQLDHSDPLKGFREKFLLPGSAQHKKTYFLGNSLGLQPVSARDKIEKVLAQWEQFGVEGFFEGENPWMAHHDRLTRLMAPIVGAIPEELSIQDALTVNLHLLFTSFYRPEGKRRKVLCEARAFPSDQYMMHSHLHQRGLPPEDHIIELQPREGEETLRMEDILATIDANRDELALVFFGGIHYYSGQLLDMAAITLAAHDAGALAAFDLAHAAGNVELHLHDWNVDFAAWCNYKYLNAGPGAIGTLFIHQRHLDSPGLPRLAGWWGNEASNRFLMEKEFRAAHGASAWQVSTPPALLFATLEASLELFQEAGWEQIRTKQEQLTAWLWFLLDELNRRQPRQVIRCITPRQEKGCQVSLLTLENGAGLFAALGRKGIMADWREPGVIRMAPVPLYNRFEEVWDAYESLAELIL
jgi:kynureninase